jgi:hypothetical protein
MSRAAELWQLNPQYGYGAGRANECVRVRSCPMYKVGPGKLCRGANGPTLGTHFDRRRPRLPRKVPVPQNPPPRQWYRVIDNGLVSYLSLSDIVYWRPELLSEQRVGCRVWFAGSAEGLVVTGLHPEEPEGILECLVVT